MFLECSLSAQGLFNVNISILPQQEVCSYNISITSSGSQPISYPAQKPIVSNKNQLTLNVSLPFNLLVNLTVIASNSYEKYGAQKFGFISSTVVLVTVVSISATESCFGVDIFRPLYPCSNMLPYVSAGEKSSSHSSFASFSSNSLRTQPSQQNCNPVRYPLPPSDSAIVLLLN
ncbi:hypothetical protein EMCRGX_G009637 [Ephydatia muelleri]